MKDGNLRSNAKNDNSKLITLIITEASQDDNQPGDFLIYIILIVIIVIISLIGVIIVRKRTKKEYETVLTKKDAIISSLQVKRKKISENNITLLKEKHNCLVHKGPIEGYSYICPSCSAYYCVKCLEAIKKLDNSCWACGYNFETKKKEEISKEVDVSKEVPNISKKLKSEKPIEAHKTKETLKIKAKTKDLEDIKKKD